MFGFRLFCVFSPAGSGGSTTCPRREASFGLATYRLIGFKLPPELLAGRRNSPASISSAPSASRGTWPTWSGPSTSSSPTLGDRGTFEVFAECRRLGHRLGSRRGPGSKPRPPPTSSAWCALFDRIDSSEAFVRPAQAFRTWATRRAGSGGHARHRGRRRRDLGRRARPSGVARGDFLEQLVASYADLDPGRAAGRSAPCDVIMLHVGAQSNLYAALAWTLVRVLDDPVVLERVRGGDDAYLERCASEAIRLAQRSITLREVLRPIEVDRRASAPTASARARCLTTMLSVTNTTAAPGLDRFDPAHYEGRRLAPDVAVPTKEVVSTFGHGTHACPAARFSISAIRIAVRRLVDAYDLTPAARRGPPAARLGGVARAERPLRIRYRARA